MKLIIPAPDLQRDLEEFDIWITPSLGEITETEKFKEELQRTTNIFEEIGKHTEGFKNEERFTPFTIAKIFTQLAEEKEEFERSEIFKSLASTLFLVTGKSDNNSKCQFPLFLRDVARWDSLPSVTRRQGRKILENSALPRTIKSDDFMNLVAAIERGTDESRLLEQFVSFLLMHEDAIKQFWALGFSYCALKKFGRGYEQNLLSPIVIFKVRGSVSASGGHEPENILRGLMENWGLIQGEDFNLNDVIVDAGEGRDQKTRAYDFVLPYKTPGWFPEWQHRIMIQSQFYAGDSGSVSHKNVDQTRTSRSRVLKKFQDARFIEYVDGAGYFSSLNSDLRKLLAMETTHSFIQIRSAPIRLRRELQALGYLTPLEIEHALIQSQGDVGKTGENLLEQGYSKNEIDRAVNRAIKNEIIHKKGSKLILLENRRSIVRQYLLLDTLSRNGRNMISASNISPASVLIPGSGAFCGLEMDAMVNFALAVAGELTEEISNSRILAADIKSLSKSGFIMVR